MSDLSAVRLGQVAVLHETDSDKLAVYLLRDVVPMPVASSVRGKIPEFTGNYFILADYDYKHINELGGVFGVFQREPSSAEAEIGLGRDGRRGLRLSFDKNEKGFCGLWIHLFNSSQPPTSRAYFNSRPFSTLSFWIRGRTGREKLTFKVADSEWIVKEDALTVGDVGSFVAGGKIDTLWRLAIVPLNKLPARVNVTQLASLVFEGMSPGVCVVELKTLAFSVEPGPFAPLPRISTTAPQRKLENAIWVWNTQEIFNSTEKEKELLSFLEKQGLNQVYLGLPYDAQDARAFHSIRLREDKFRSLLLQLNKRGIKVHALIGDKELVFPDQHAFVLATMENVIQYNASSRPGERFYGFHLDVEPYLLPGFNGPRRQTILANFVTLLSKVSERARQAAFPVGADIPYWFDSPDEFTQQPITVEFGGSIRPLHECVIDLMDNVVLMSYRTSAIGMDGIILQSLEEITYALKKEKQVFVGLETGPIPDEDVLTFRGKPTVGSFNPPPSRLHFFLVQKNDGAQAYIVQDERMDEFHNFLKSSGAQQSQILHWNISQEVSTPSHKVTFAALKPKDLFHVMEQGSLELTQQPSFRGFAIHFYESYKKFLSQNGVNN